MPVKKVKKELTEISEVNHAIENDVINPANEVASSETASESIVTHVDTDDNVTDCLNLDEFHPSESESISRKSTKSGAISLVYSKNGIRLSMAKYVVDKLRDPKAVQVSLSKDSVAIGEYLPNNQNSYTVRKCGEKGILYAAKLVEEIIRKFNLDFTGKTSLTYPDVTFTTYNGYPVAVVKITSGDHSAA